MKLTGWVTDIDQFSTHDGPGIRTTIFLQGCPLRCRWCHSPETQPLTAPLLYQKAKCICCGTCISVCPQEAVSADLKICSQGMDSEALEVSVENRARGVIIDRTKCNSCFVCTKTCSSGALRVGSRERSVGEIMKILMGNRPFFANSGGGVTITGGEILMQPEFVEELLRECHKEEIHTAIETSGFGRIRHLLAIAEFSDLIFYDIKNMNDRKHREYTGTGNHRILENLKKLCEIPGQAQKVIVRIPCIPQINDDEENLLRTAEFISGLGIREMELLAYNAAAPAKYEWIGREYSLKDVVTRKKAEYVSTQNRIQEIFSVHCR